MLLYAFFSSFVSFPTLVFLLLVMFRIILLFLFCPLTRDSHPDTKEKRQMTWECVSFHVCFLNPMSSEGSIVICFSVPLKELWRNHDCTNKFPKRDAFPVLLKEHRETRPAKERFPT